MYSQPFFLLYFFRPTTITTIILQPATIKTSGIYKIINLINGRFYIGSAVQLNKRTKNHLYDLRANRHSNYKLQHDWLVHGEDNFSLEVIEEVKSAHLIEREQFWMDTLKPKYNIRLTAENSLGAKHSEESKIKVGLASKGRRHSEETKEFCRQINIGRQKSPETRKKLSEANIGKKQSPERVEKNRLAHLGRKHTDEAKRKIGLASKGNTHMLGKKRSPEAIEKLKATIARKRIEKQTTQINDNNN